MSPSMVLEDGFLAAGARAFVFSQLKQGLSLKRIFKAL